MCQAARKKLFKAALQSKGSLPTALTSQPASCRSEICNATFSASSKHAHSKSQLLLDGATSANVALDLHLAVSQSTAVGLAQIYPKKEWPDHLYIVSPRLTAKYMLFGPMDTVNALRSLAWHRVVSLVWRFLDGIQYGTNILTYTLRIKFLQNPC